MPALPKCHYVIKINKPPSRVSTTRSYQSFPITLGDYLRKRRLDLGLRQKDVAAIIQTTVCSIRNWENNLHQPYLQAIPAIINFTGFCPYDPNLAFHQKLIIWRSVNGIRQREMADLIGVDQSTLAKWEQGKRTPNIKHQQRISEVLATMGIFVEKRTRVWS
jgi:transcriptional regulator with XRE-family HTH domain